MFGTYRGRPGIGASGRSLAGSIHGQRVANTQTPTDYARGLTQPRPRNEVQPFNSEPGYAQNLVNAINLVIRLLPCF